MTLSQQNKPNLEAQLQELRREISMRQRCYPQWVRQGRMTAEQSQHRIACLSETLVSLEKLDRIAKQVQQELAL